MILQVCFFPPLNAGDFHSQVTVTVGFWAGPSLVEDRGRIDWGVQASKLAIDTKDLIFGHFVLGLDRPTLS